MLVQCTCLQCGKAFDLLASRVARGNGRFCSWACSHAALRRRVEKPCVQCGKPLMIKPCFASRNNFCDRRCFGLWKRTGTRYVQSGKKGHEHRYVWEAAHGPIPPGYHIHHINGDKRDNRLENLTCLSASEHAKLHHSATHHRSRIL